MKYLTIFLSVMMMLALTACEEEGATRDAPAELALMTHDSFDASEEVLAAFEAEHNVQIALLPSGDAGAALNQAILAKADPLADVFFGVDNTFMGRALEEEIFLPYESPLLAAVPDELELDASHHLTPVDFGDVCLNYDRARFGPGGPPLPGSLADLADPAYAGMLVVENPATSSPGLAFLLATVEVFGEDGVYTYLDYWRDLRANDVLVTDGWEDAYYGQFSAAGDGDRPLVVSYATSPPAEVVFAEPPVDEPPTGAITAPQTCFRQVEFAGILAGTEQPELAQAFIDFMLGEQFQEDIPLRMFVFPASEEAALPDVFVSWGEVAEQPVQLDPARIDAGREEWILAWTEAVLR